MDFLSLRNTITLGTKEMKKPKVIDYNDPKTRLPKVIVWDSETDKPKTEVSKTGSIFSPYACAFMQIDLKKTREEEIKQNKVVVLEGRDCLD